MTAGWIDCLSAAARMGRGVAYRGRWATPTRRPSVTDARQPLTRAVHVPGIRPRLTCARSTRSTTGGTVPRVRRGIVHPKRFFYPLDSSGELEPDVRKTRLHPVPVRTARGARTGCRRAVSAPLTKRGGASFLVRHQGLRTGGYRAAVVSEGRHVDRARHPHAARRQSLVDALNELVIDEGGRIYLAKDALTRPDHFRRMEPRLDEFLRVRRSGTPQGGSEAPSRPFVRLVAP